MKYPLHLIQHHLEPYARGQASHAVTPQIWNLLDQQLTRAKQRSVWQLYQGDPAEMGAMLSKTLTELFAERPDLRREVERLLAQVEPPTVSGGTVGIVNMQNSDLRGAQNLNITGVSQSFSQTNRTVAPAPPKTSTPPTALPSPDKLRLLCYDYFPKLYRTWQRPLSAATMWKQLADVGLTADDLRLMLGETKP